MPESIAAEVVRVDIAVVVLTFAINQVKGVFTGQTSHADATLSGFIPGSSYVDTFLILQHIQQVDMRSAQQVVLGDHGDTGRSVSNLLLKTGGGHDDLVDGSPVLNCLSTNPASAH